MRVVEDAHEDQIGDLLDHPERVLAMPSAQKAFQTLSILDRRSPVRMIAIPQEAAQAEEL